jgi:hypothetical protein
MNIFEILCKNAAFKIDPGLDKNGPLWKMMEAYAAAKDAGEDTSAICSLEQVLQSSEVLAFVQNDHKPLVNL